MELSSEILESLVMDNKDVMEVLKDGSVTEEDIIFEATEDSEEAEIEEIIEIIEEVDECDETTPDGDISLEGKDKNAVNTKDGGTVERTEKNDQATKKTVELYGFDEENSVFASQSDKKGSAKDTNSSIQKTINKQVINYDVDEDWQDEELERIDELDNTSELADNCTDPLQIDKTHINNQTVLLQSNKIDLRIHADPVKRSDKSRTDSGIENNINNINDDSETTHEIVKNVENNLLYTVLGTKKQDSSKQQQEKLNDAQYVKVSISLKYCTEKYNLLILLMVVILDGTTRREHYTCRGYHLL